MYRRAGDLQICAKDDFHGENLWILAGAPKDATPPNFVEETL